MDTKGLPTRTQLKQWQIALEEVPDPGPEVVWLQRDIELRLSIPRQLPSSAQTPEEQDTYMTHGLLHLRRFERAAETPSDKQFLSAYARLVLADAAFDLTFDDPVTPMAAAPVPVPVDDVRDVGDLLFPGLTDDVFVHGLIPAGLTYVDLLSLSMIRKGVENAHFMRRGWLKLAQLIFVDHWTKEALPGRASDMSTYCTALRSALTRVSGLERNVVLWYHFGLQCLSRVILPSCASIDSTAAVLNLFQPWSMGQLTVPGERLAITIFPNGPTALATPNNREFLGQQFREVTLASPWLGLQSEYEASPCHPWVTYSTQQGFPLHYLEAILHLGSRRTYGPRSLMQRLEQDYPNTETQEQFTANCLLRGGMHNENDLFVCFLADWEEKSAYNMAQHVKSLPNSTYCTTTPEARSRLFLVASHSLTRAFAKSEAGAQFAEEVGLVGYAEITTLLAGYMTDSTNSTTFLSIPLFEPPLDSTATSQQLNALRPTDYGPPRAILEVHLRFWEDDVICDYTLSYVDWAWAGRTLLHPKQMNSAGVTHHLASFLNWRLNGYVDNWYAPHR
jgi:hypothetical protein